MTPQQIHEMLVAEGQRQDLPKHYKNDLLVHDLTTLSDTGTQKFIWVLRECGTHLHPLDSDQTKYPGRLDRQWIYAVLNQYGGNALYYKFADGRLQSIPFDRVTSHL